MMKLTLETTNSLIANLIKSAYDKAIEATNFDYFMIVLYRSLPEYIEVGQSGSHVWISRKSDGKRLAIIKI